MSDKPIPKDPFSADSTAHDDDAEHTVIDMEWGEKYRAIQEEMAAKEAAGQGDDSSVEPAVDSVSNPPTPALNLGDPAALTALDFHIDTDDLSSSGPIEPPTMADRPVSNAPAHNEVFAPDEVPTKSASPDVLPKLPSDLTGPGFTGPVADSVPESDSGDDWGVVGHAQTGAWGVDETAFLQVDPTGDDHALLQAPPQGEEVVEPSSEMVGQLVATSPDFAGNTFDLFLGEFSVGRAEDCHLSFDEPSVSRQHATLSVDAEGVRVFDNGSNNGTFVNGKRVRDAMLKSRDEVAFGTVTTRFIASQDEFLVDTRQGQLPGENSQRARGRVWESVRSHPYGLPILVSGVLMVATAVVALHVVSDRATGPAADVKSDKVFQYFLDGIEAFKARQWDQAEEQFKILKGLDSSHIETLEYLDAIGEERRAENDMKLARAVRKQGHLKKGLEHAKAARNSLYQKDVARELILSIKAEVDARLARARVSLEAGQLVESIRLLDELDEQYPGRSDVRALSAFAASLNSKQSNSGMRQAARGARKVQASQVQEKLPDEKEERQVGIIGQAEKLFLAGDLQGALKILEQEGGELDAHMLADQIRQFADLWQVGVAEHRAKRSISALKALDELAFLEGKISATPSKFRNEIDRKRADMHYLGGVEALGHGRYALSARRFKRALLVLPTYEPAIRQLANLHERASELALQARTSLAADPSLARKLWSDVLAMSAENHPLHTEALKALKNP